MKDVIDLSQRKIYTASCVLGLKYWKVVQAIKKMSKPKRFVALA